MRSVAVFCGASSGRGPLFLDAAVEMGRLLARSGWRLVYGGGRIGLMGALADAALDAGGHVVGVIPRELRDREHAHQGLTEIHVVDGMHERKALMGALADAFVALPGGFGTLEELFEALTWTQLGLHGKPCCLVNVSGFFDPLRAHLDGSVDEAFLSPEDRRLAVFVDAPSEALDFLASLG